VGFVHLPRTVRGYCAPLQFLNGGATHADHRSTRTTLEALTHMTSSKGAPLQSGVGALSLSA